MQAQTAPVSRNGDRLAETNTTSVHEARFNRMKSPLLAPIRLPNDDVNYEKSPAAKHALRDGSFDETRMTGFNTTFHRKLKMRDTFTVIFPSYTHGERTTYDKNKSFMHNAHKYETKAYEHGGPIH